MAKNNEALKKHHFWILTGLVPLLVLIAVITVSSSVGGEIQKKVDDYEKAQKEIAQKQNPKSNKLIEEVQKQVEKVSLRKGDLWQTNWDRQKDQFTWPNWPMFKEIEKKNLKFGSPLPNDRDQFERFKDREVYLAEYSTVGVTKALPGAKGMADLVAPTQFRNGWQTILRHVVDKGWGNRVLTSEQIWLLMEDIWVQRSMLEAVRSVNAQMAAFDRVEYKKDGVAIDEPLRRKFKSRIWELELEVARNEENKQVMKGRLVNTTDRLQLMGLNNTMIVRVWFEKPEDENGKPRKDVRPWDFKIGGEFLPGSGALKPDGKTPADTLDIVPTRDHEIPATMPVVEIAKVEQVFDTRTVPVRRIEAVAMGERAKDSRHAAAQLFAPAFIKEEAPTDSTGSGGGGGFGSGSGPPPGMSMGPAAGGGTGIDKTGLGGGGAAAGSRVAGGANLDAIVNQNKKRYLNNPKGAGTDAAEVRRMPVAMAVVVDQAYLQDVLLAFANSPLRFQITQVNWARFRDGLGDGGTGGGGSQGGPAGGLVLRGAGGGGGLGTEFGSGGLRPGGPKTGGSSQGPPPGMSMGPMGGGTDSPGSMFGSQGLTVSESQLTSGLIQLDVYGIVSLYEKVPVPGEVTPPEGTAGTTPKDPAAGSKDTEKKDGDKKDGEETKKEGDGEAKDKGPTDPKDKEPAGKDPMPADPKDSKPPKMRRVRTRS